MTPWVLRLIVLNVIVFAAQVLLPGLTRGLECVPALLLERPWTAVTYLFVHGGFAHILFNMIALFFFGPRVEQRLGGPNFLGLYFTSGIAGALLSWAVPSMRFIPIVGASGAIMGVGIAFAKYWPRERFLIWGIIPLEAWLLILLYIVSDVAGAFGFGMSGIANLAHLGGVGAGYIYLRIMELSAPARRWQRKVAAPSTPRPFADADQMRRWRDIRLDDLHPINRDEIVRLLDKVQHTGVRSLTPDERATLDRFS